MDDGIGFAHPGSIFGKFDHVSAGLSISQKGQHRDKKRRAIENGKASRIERLQPEPIVNSDTSVYPGDDEPRALLPDVAGIEYPMDQQHVSIGIVGPGELVGALSADNVTDQQERNCEPQRQLRGLSPWHDECSALIKRPGREPEMGHQRGNEEYRAGRTAPHPEEPNPARLHRVERDQAERMVDEMRRHVGQKNEPRDQAQASNHACPRARSIPEGRWARSPETNRHQRRRELWFGFRLAL